MSGKELNIEAQNRIIRARQLMEKGEISIPDYQTLRSLGLELSGLLGEFMEWLEKHNGDLSALQIA